MVIKKSRYSYCEDHLLLLCERWTDAPPKCLYCCRCGGSTGLQRIPSPDGLLNLSTPTEVCYGVLQVKIERDQALDDAATVVWNSIPEVLGNLMLQSFSVHGTSIIKVN
jgi:hypothetical protein